MALTSVLPACAIEPPCWAATAATSPRTSHGDEENMVEGRNGERTQGVCKVGCLAGWAVRGCPRYSQMSSLIRYLLIADPSCTLPHFSTSDPRHSFLSQILLWSSPLRPVPFTAVFFNNAVCSVADLHTAFWGPPMQKIIIMNRSLNRRRAQRRLIVACHVSTAMLVEHLSLGLTRPSGPGSKLLSYLLNRLYRSLAVRCVPFGHRNLPRVSHYLGILRWNSDAFSVEIERSEGAHCKDRRRDMLKSVILPYESARVSPPPRFHCTTRESDSSSWQTHTRSKLIQMRAIAATGPEGTFWIGLVTLPPSSFIVSSSPCITINIRYALDGHACRRYTMLYDCY